MVLRDINRQNRGDCRQRIQDHADYADYLRTCGV